MPAVKLMGSPASRMTRASWMCEELGVDYDIEAVKPHSAALKAVNPAGKGPVLVDGETVVIDSAAICLYLGDKFSDRGMSAEPGSTERAALDSWVQFAQLDLEGPLWLKMRHTFILPEDDRLDLKDHPKRDFARAVDAMHQRLGDRQFAIGERFTAADILLGHTGHWARSAKFPIESARVNAYFDRVLERPALERARKREAAVSYS